MDSGIGVDATGQPGQTNDTADRRRDCETHLPEGCVPRRPYIRLTWAPNSEKPAPAKCPLSAPDEHDRRQPTWIVNSAPSPGSQPSRCSVGVAVIGCGNRGAATPAATTGPTPAPQATAADQPQVTLAPAPTDSATDAASATPSDSASPSPSSATGATHSQPTTDPVTTDLTNLDNIINGVNGSVSGGDAGTSGGE
jgi:hypothetical protein